MVHRYVECSGVYMCMCVLDQILQDPAKMAIVTSFPMPWPITESINLCTKSELVQAIVEEELLETTYERSKKACV